MAATEHGADERNRAEAVIGRLGDDQGDTICSVAESFHGPGSAKTIPGRKAEESADEQRELICQTGRSDVSASPPGSLIVRILVVEDEPKLRSLLDRGLQSEGYSVDQASNGDDAIWLASEFDYDAVVLDIQIPGPDGIDVARELRKRSRWAPILFLTVKDDISDRVAGLDAGGDDYLTKPFAFAELFARLRSLIRRSPGPRPTMLHAGDLSLDPATHLVTKGAELLSLSPKEFSLLEYLLRNQGDAVSRTEILDHVWDFAYEGTSNVVDVYVGYLRAKVGHDRIETVRGVGYRLVGGVPG